MKSGKIKGLLQTHFWFQTKPVDQISEILASGSDRDETNRTYQS